MALILYLYEEWRRKVTQKIIFFCPNFGLLLIIVLQMFRGVTAITAATEITPVEPVRVMPAKGENL